VCYSIYLSTTSGEDLTTLSATLFSFERVAEADKDFLAPYPHCWRLIGEGGGCSCHFRHTGVEGTDLEFRHPEGWAPEDEDEIAATLAVYDVFAGILAAGHELEVADLWEGTPPEVAQTVEVSLSQVPPNSFRFFEDHRFILKP
jgi:hypothetical protein